MFGIKNVNRQTRSVGWCKKGQREAKRRKRKKGKDPFFFFFLLKLFFFSFFFGFFVGKWKSLKRTIILGLWLILVLCMGLMGMLRMSVIYRFFFFFFDSKKKFLFLLALVSSKFFDNNLILDLKMFYNSKPSHLCLGRRNSCFSTYDDSCGCFSGYSLFSLWGHSGRFLLPSPFFSPLFSSHC